MSDSAEFWKDLRDFNKAKKDEYINDGRMNEEIRKAKTMSCSFTFFNEYHMRITINTDKGLKDFDFWPTTRKWKSVRGNANGHGIDKLKAYLRIN